MATSAKEKARKRASFSRDSKYYLQTTIKSKIGTPLGAYTLERDTLNTALRSYAKIYQQESDDIERTVRYLDELLLRN